MAIVALALAGCGGGGGGSGGGGTTPPPPPPPTTYSIGGTVSGLTGTGLVLQDNGGDNLSVTANGAFTFATKVDSGGAYAVTVLTQPSGQTCTVADGTGTTGSANVTNVAVNCTGGSASVGKFAYVANNGDGTIDAYTIDPNSGALTAVSGIPDGTAPAAVSLAPNGMFAFSASDNGTKIQAFTIGSSGALTLVGTYNTGFVNGSTYPDIAVDSQSAHLYLASAGDNEVAGFAIDQSSGALTPLTGSPYPAGAGASAIPAFSPNGKFLYVMDQSATVGTTEGNAVSGYSIGTDGSLTPIPGSPFAAGTGPTWISFTPDGNFAYVADTGEDAISAYSVNTTTGALTPLSTPTYTTDEHPQDLTIDSSGQHLYAPVANGSTAGAVQVFTINADGALTAVGSTPAGVTPVFLDIDPTAAFAYVASKDGAEVYGYSISSSTGALTALSPSSFSTGTGSLPQFITIDPSGKFGYTANEGTANISEFAIDQTTGDLNPIVGNATIPAGLKPIFVSISPEAAGIRD
ncbi:MAG: lactonase family protein [Steroidobacteraceae bacterium]